MTRGGFILIVGPSGAGKDTLIDRAKEALAADERFIFAKRIVTRESTRWEDHDTLDVATFDAHQAKGQFALSWLAHGLGYAIPRTLIDEALGGKIVICNVSRTVLAEARLRLPNVSVIEITATLATLEQRLKNRSRDGEEGISARLERSVLAYDHPADLVIHNDGPPEEGAALLINYIRKVS